MRHLNFTIIWMQLIILTGCQLDNEPQKNIAFSDQEKIVLSKKDLKDKVKGGWAGQVIGCTYGGPTEFKWLGSMINDKVPIPWDENQMKFWYDQFPGLYDDVYMDLTFVSVFEKHGLDAPTKLHAEAFANAGYTLWHGNQAARYNILNGIEAPESGHYYNNPHANDIDFQIEADFAGLMSPGMINSSSKICDEIGHIMTYGDGWYGGVFIAAMYSQAFVSNDINFIVREALKAIPLESQFYKMISDVIEWHKLYPEDWKRTWFEIQQKWSFEHGCPDGVFKPLNIEASLNATYIVLGLLYGEADYGKTIDISTRAGQDSDCNPSNAAGILGTMIGYDNIPKYWKQGLDKVENVNFSYIDMSLLDAYDISYNHAEKMIAKHGGKILRDSVEIRYQKVIPVRFEESFAGLQPKEIISYQWPFDGKMIDNEEDEYEIEFEGAGIVISGYPSKAIYNSPNHNLKIEVYVNNEFTETLSIPTETLVRKTDIYWNYQLKNKNNTIKLVSSDIPSGYQVNFTSALIYSN
ncbi:hypothetical protein DHD08_05370 [Arenibacter sp. H213]|nr:hypothetical protein [Arenibacter sp. H213]